MLPTKIQTQFIISLSLFVACLLLIRFSEDFMLIELCKAVALFGSIFMFRIVSHHSNPLKK